MAKWKRKSRRYYELQGLHHTAYITRDRQKVWFCGVWGFPEGFKKSPNKQYAKFWATEQLRQLEADSEAAKKPFF
jgi:hypothetical protein